MGVAELPELAKKFVEIKAERKDAELRFATRQAIGPSVLRVFEAGSRADIEKGLLRVHVEALRGVHGRVACRAWYEAQLPRVHRALEKRNKTNTRMTPGLKWGHATKVVSLFVREVCPAPPRAPDRTCARLAPYAASAPQNALAFRARRPQDRLLGC